jgi:ATP-binding cassette, subfamily C, bacterial exporter for protease/lipase
MATSQAVSSRLNSELGQVFKAYKSAFLTVGAFSLVTNVLGLVPSLYMLQIYDRVLSSRNYGTLWAISLIALGLMALLAALEWVRAYVLVRVGNRIESEVNERLFSATFASTLRQAGGNPAQALIDFTNVRQFMTGTGVAFFDLPWAPIYLVVCFLLHPMLGGVALFGLIVSITLAVISSRMTEPALAMAQASSLRANAFANNNLRNAEVIQAMGMLANVRARWATFNSQLLVQQSQASDRAGVLSSISKNFRIVMQSAILGAGAYLVIEGSSTPGTMIAASILMGKALGPVDQALASWKQVVQARTAWDRLTALFTEFPKPPKGLSLPSPQGALSVENVIAAPPGVKAPVLRGVSFSAAPGDILGVIGPSASGKSTLARVLMGIWPAAAGKVRLDGADVFSWDKVELGPHVGYLPQDVELFDGTVAENIARFGPLDSERIVRAAQIAGVHEMILRLPDGYDTQLGAGGSALSGGQRQRIGLARALYGDPAFVVLDEPNSNLDEAGEAALQQALAIFKKLGKTMVVITHRPSVLNIVDKLLFLNEGTVVAFGPRQQVMNALAQAQAKAQAQARANAQAQIDASMASAETRDESGMVETAAKDS